MSKSLFFELNDDVGLAPSHIVKDGAEVENPEAGKPEPIHHLRVPIATPVVVKDADGNDEIIMSTSIVEIKPGTSLDDATKTRVIPGSRVIETQNSEMANVLMTLSCHQVDPPKSEQSRTSRDGGDK